MKRAVQSSTGYHGEAASVHPLYKYSQKTALHVHSIYLRSKEAVIEMPQPLEWITKQVLVG